MQSKGGDKTGRALVAYKNLVRATESIVGLLERQLLECKLTMGQFRALEALLGRGPMSQAELGGAIFCGSSSESLVIKFLEERGLVARHVDASDRKKKVVRITAEGEELARKILPLQARLVRARMAALGEREQKSLARLCEKLDVGNPLKFVRELTRLDGEAEARSEKGGQA